MSYVLGCLEHSSIVHDHFLRKYSLNIEQAKAIKNSNFVLKRDMKLT